MTWCIRFIRVQYSSIVALMRAVPSCKREANLNQLRSSVGPYTSTHNALEVQTMHPMEAVAVVCLHKKRKGQMIQTQHYMSLPNMFAV